MAGPCCAGGSIPEWRVTRVPFAPAALGHGAMPLRPGVLLLWLSAKMLPGLSLLLSPSLGQAPAMEIREQTGKLSPTREFPLGRAGPSRQGISPSSSPPLSPKVTPLPQGKSPSVLPKSSQHTPCLRGSLLPGGESLSWDVSQSCPPFLPAGAEGSLHPQAAPHPPTPSIVRVPGCEGSLWVEGYVRALWGQGASHRPSQSPHPCLGLGADPFASPCGGSSVWDRPLLGAGGPSLSPPAWAQPRSSSGRWRDPLNPGPVLARRRPGGQSRQLSGDLRSLLRPALVFKSRRPGAKQGWVLSGGSGVLDCPDNSRSPVPSGGAGALQR